MDHLLQFSGILAMLPVAIGTATGRIRCRGGLFWILMAVASVGLIVQGVSPWEGWRSDLPFTLWVSAAACLLVFFGLAFTDPRFAGLAPLMTPLVVILNMAAVFLTESGGIQIQPLESISPWIVFHIVVAVITYAALTIGAIAALSALIQERALKRKSPLLQLRDLPSLMECEALIVRLLWISLVVMVAGLLTGVALNASEGAQLLAFDHKTILVFAVIFLVGGLLIVHQRTGARGRRVAHLVLLAYLLITLAYPGVKFVTDVLLAT